MKASKLWRSVLCLVICFAMVMQPMTLLAFAAGSAELITNGTVETDADGWSYINSIIGDMEVQVVTPREVA